MAKSTTCSRAFVTPKLSWPTAKRPFCTPGMIVANVPFWTVQETPRTLATALRRSTSNPTSSPSGVWPLWGRPEVPGVSVVPSVTVPLLRMSAGSAACSAGSVATADTTSAVG